MQGSDFSKLLQVIGANIAIVVLSLIGFAIAANFTWGALLLFLLIVSISQGGLMIRAFGPAVGCEYHLTLGGKVVGWIGFIGWFAIHLLLAGVITFVSMHKAIWLLGTALIIYFVIHTIASISFYRQIFMLDRITIKRPKTDTIPEKSAEEIQRETEAREQIEQKHKTDQQQRDEARLHCLLLYDEHAHNLTNRFPRERLMEYFQQYLADSFSVELVEQRAERLKEMIESSLHSKGRNRQKFSSFIDITNYFQEQRKEIELLDYDDSVKQSFLTSLNLQEDRAVREFTL